MGQTEHNGGRLAVRKVSARSEVATQVQQVVARATARLATQGVLEVLLTTYEVLRAPSVTKANLTN